MLPIAGLFPGNVPIRHPAELLAFAVLQYDQEGIQRDLLLLFSQPRFQLVWKERRNHSEFAFAVSELEIEAQPQLPQIPASRAILRSSVRELVKGVEQRLVRRVLLMTLMAVEAWGRHG